MSPSEVQRLLLRVLANPASDRRLGRGMDYLARAVREAAPEGSRPTNRQIQAAYWGLVARGLAFVDMTQQSPENWSLELTDAGAAAQSDEEYNPDEPSGYLALLYRDVPDLSALCKLYIEEAVNAYFHGTHLASTVMLGVAAEAAFLDVASAFAGWLNDTSGQNLAKVLNDPKQTYVRKFEEFRKRLLPTADRLPHKLADGLELQMNSILDLLRVNRNEAGHPTGVVLGRDDCFVNLRLFARLAHRLYDLKTFFATAA